MSLDKPSAMIRPSRVLLIRPDHNQADAVALAAHGIGAVIEPWLRVVALQSDALALLTAQLNDARPCTWLFVTSPRTYPLWEQSVPDLSQRLADAKARGMSVATTGPATSATLPVAVDLEPKDRSAAGILAELSPLPRIDTTLHPPWQMIIGDVVSGKVRVGLCPGSARRSPTLAAGLADAGWRVVEADVYDTRPVEVTPDTAQEVTDGKFDAVLLRSGTAVAALAQYAQVPDGCTIIAVGPNTTKAARGKGWRVVSVPVGSHAEVAAAVAHALEHK